MEIDTKALWATIGRHGFNAVLATVVLYFMAFYIVVPMRDDQRAFMQSVVKTNEQNAESTRALTTVQQAQATTLTAIASTQQELLNVQRQIRDDQRKFPAVSEAPKPQ